MTMNVQDAERELRIYSERLDRALATFEQKQQAQLYRKGQPIYAPEEHARQVEALVKQTIDREVEAANNVAAKLQAEAERLLADLHADPADSLTTAELERANAKQVYVKEDCERLPFTELANRLQSVLSSGDKPTQFLHLRYTRMRLDALEAQRRANPNRGPIHLQDSEGIVEVMQGVEALEAKLLDPAGVKAKAEQYKKQAWLLLQKAQQTRQQADGTTAKRQAQMRRYYQQLF
jgi:hypothetical protein